MDSYDQIPYQSTPFSETSPHALATLARLFGVQSADPERCRVLEIGCATGGNLIPMALELPESRFLGVELSERQAQDGAGLIARLGLDNIEIRQGDITGFPTDPQGFDYIIAHGVYSWMPQAAREAMLAVIRRNLTPGGIAYISYNTLPGWRWRGVLRDLLLFHCRRLEQPGARLEAAHQLLNLLERQIGDASDPQSRFLRQELKRIRSHPASYLYHEYLEQENTPFLFTDFVTDCDRHGLRYLCDCDLNAMFTFSQGEELASWLEQQEDDLVAQWQYLDFFSQRTFRQSLLCRDDLPGQREIDLEAFAGFSFHTRLQPPKRLDLRRGKRVDFFSADGEPCPVEHPLTQCALLLLIERFPHALPLEELTAVAAQHLSQIGNPQQAAEHEALQAELFALFARQRVAARTTPCRPAWDIPSHPSLSRLAREQLTLEMKQLTAIHHSTLQLDPFGLALTHLCDGTRSQHELIDQMVMRMEHAPELLEKLPQAQRKPTQRLRQAVEEQVRHLLALLTRNGLLAQPQDSDFSLRKA